MKKILTILFGISLSIQVAAQWLGTNPIYFNAGSVGIGNSSPSGLLHLKTSSSSNFWSSYNYGATLVIDGPHHNAIALLDAGSSNPFAIANVSGKFAVSKMPALGDVSTAPFELFAIVNDGRISTYSSPPVGTFNVGTPSNSNAMTLGSSTGVGFSNTISGLYGLYMGVSGTGNTWIQGGRSDGQAIAYDISLQAVGGKVGIGTAQPHATLDVYSSGTLGSNQGNSLLLSRFSSSAGTGNLFMNNNWLLRDGAGSDWLTARLHNGISIDGSFLTPGTDTRTWWERDPFHNIQSWGDQANVYLTINNGNVGIGNTSPDAKLAVSGQVHAQEVKVSVTVPGPDYVFEKDYKLSSLEEIKNYIDQNKHLPEVPSAKEMEKNGVQLGEMNMLLLKKIEELTLYVIDLKNENKELKSRIEMVEKK